VNPEALPERGYAALLKCVSSVKGQLLWPAAKAQRELFDVGKTELAHCAPYPIMRRETRVKRRGALSSS